MNSCSLSLSSASMPSSGSRGSGRSSASWVSAPACSSGPHCFLPETHFRRPDGSYVTAAALKRSGDILVGPEGKFAQVLHVEKYKPEEREVVCLTTADASFRITSDHRLLVKGPNGSAEPVLARDLLAGGRMPEVFDGSTYNIVKDLKLTRLRTQVVDVCFEEELIAVLAWTFPPRRKPRIVRNSAAVACLGRQVADRMMLMIGDDCLTPLANKEYSMRSRSCGAPANPTSTWSVGSLRHSDDDPGRCRVCAVHHRFMLDTQEPKTASPCRHGPACKYCHEPHLERSSRIRSRNAASSSSAPASSSQQHSR